MDAFHNVVTSFETFATSNMIITAAGVCVGIATKDAIQGMLKSIFGSSGGSMSVLILSYLSSKVDNKPIKLFIKILSSIIYETSVWFFTILIAFILFNFVLAKNIKGIKWWLDKNNK